MAIYLDHAATTPVDPRVAAAMEPFWAYNFGNPASFHSYGLAAKKALEAARGSVAKIIGAQPSEIVFTGGGTESVNLALKGVARANKERGRHIITSKIEHHAVLHSCEALEKEGFEVTYLDVDKYGLVDPADVERAIRPDTILISIMYANNEIGTIEPIAEIGAIARKRDIPFHTDACQAGGACELDVRRLNVDLMTLNGSKIYGPKGVGMLYIHKGVLIEPIIHGGGQEAGLRSGTENVPGIIGFAKALELAQASRQKECARLIKLRDRLVEGILKSIPDSFLNGHPTKRLPNNVNVTILNIEGESLVLQLDRAGIAASTGSACSSERLEPSHVLLAIGLPKEAAHGSLRLTLGHSNSDADVDYVLKTLPPIVERLRAISPVRIKKSEVGR